ncbi:hypothetical protein RvY_08177 [Ramazzottius varieornatus]|uniref:IMS import disulfide relay-system CHCH-CHCH-like Cx9C domain-containing protein n=1 Tax=Ramazzottius varieornatus TaxID=947166 RepID=A0A1D1V4V5_RAMVA|nr:hypothetical protein RvY_08177 [Ramazzottius varieornatus]
MSSSVERARRKMHQFPVAFAKCTEHSVVYARCISSTEHPEKGQCQKEFAFFKNCFQKAMSESLSK